MFRFPVEMDESESTERDRRLDSMVSPYNERSLVIDFVPSEAFS